MQAVVQHVETIRGQMVDSLKDLVRFPTVTLPGSHYADLWLLS